MRSVKLLSVAVSTQRIGSTRLFTCTRRADIGKERILALSSCPKLTRAFESCLTPNAAIVSVSEVNWENIRVLCHKFWTSPQRVTRSTKGIEYTAQGGPYLQTFENLRRSTGRDRSLVFRVCLERKPKGLKSSRNDDVLHQAASLRHERVKSAWTRDGSAAHYSGIPLWVSFHLYLTVKHLCFLEAHFK